MNQRPLFAVFAAVVALVGSPAFAQEQTKADGQDLIERVVVRNRLYDMNGRWELSPSVGFTILNRLTDHFNFNLGLAYNVSNTVAFELRGGYAYSRHTALASDLSAQVLQENPNSVNSVTDDLSGLWQMEGNATLGVRWAPIYGKLGLLSELPVHFQFYLWAGGGAGSFSRESTIYCQQVPESRSDGLCGNWLTENRVSWLASGAVGFRFFTHQGGGLRLEVRDYTFPDAYREKIDRRVAEAGGDTGTPAKNPGLTHLVLFDLGYSFIF